MHKLVSTPRSRKSVLVIAAVLFATAPLVVAQYYYGELQRGTFPIDRDSIGIPIFQFVIVLVMTAPISWGVVWICANRYPGAVSFGVWNNKRPLWSAFWTIALVGVAIAFLLLTPWSTAVRHPLLIAHVLIDFYFLLVLRSGVVGQAKHIHN